MESKIAYMVAWVTLAFVPAAAFSQSDSAGPGDTAESAVTSAATTAIPGILPAFITAGNIDPNDAVPSINKVPGSAVTNADLAFPLTVLLHGTRYVYSIALQDYSYTGSCTVAYKLTQVKAGKTVTLDEGTITTFDSAPNDIWLWVATGKAIPDSPGEATLTGTVTYGKQSVSTSATVVLK